MKIRNLAFCGVMASILGVSGAYATDATIIASKAYVDARDNTKQDTANIVTETWANSTADHSSPTKYPSMKTLESAVGAGTSALDGQNADSSTGVSAGAAADNNKVGMPVVKVTETDGIVTSELGTIKNAGIASDAAITTNKMGAITGYQIAATEAALTTDDTLNEALGKLEKKADVAQTTADAKWNTKQVAVQGNYENGWSNESVITEEDRGKSSNLGAAKARKDTFVPTMLAVERYVAENAGTSIGQATQNASANKVITGVTTNNGIVTAVSDTQITNDYVADNAAITTNKMGAITDYTISTATGAARNLAATDTLNEALGKLEKKADDNATTVNNLDLAEVKEAGKPIVAVKQEDGKVGASLGTISYSAGLDYKLSEINTTNDDGSSNCKVGSPCVLTMVMSGGKPVYEWTNMETDGLNANL